MNAAEVVAAGFDELQHINFLFLQFLAGPGDDTRTPLRYVRVAERGNTLDLDSAEVRAFLDLLAHHHTVIAAGKRADLLLVDGDPTRDISAIRRLDAVVCRGLVYDPDELFATLGIGPRNRASSGHAR
jgi:hypothetical protein